MINSNADTTDVNWNYSLQINCRVALLTYNPKEGRGSGVWCVHKWNPEPVGIRRNLLKLNTNLKDSDRFMVEKISSYILYQSRFLQDKMPPLSWVVGEDFHIRTHCGGVDRMYGNRRQYSRAVISRECCCPLTWRNEEREESSGTLRLSVWCGEDCLTEAGFLGCGRQVAWQGQAHSPCSLQSAAKCLPLLNSNGSQRESPLRWSLQTSFLGYKIGWRMAESESGGANERLPSTSILSGKISFVYKGANIS